MGGGSFLCDTGPLVAFFDRNDQHHAWASEQFRHITPPLITCEAVISEAVFLLHDDGLSSEPILEALERRQLVVQFLAEDQWPDLRRLMSKYADVPMSFADACLVRMSEIVAHSRVFTIDGDFRIYRRLSRQMIPLLAPF